MNSITSLFVASKYQYLFQVWNLTDIFYLQQCFSCWCFGNSGATFVVRSDISSRLCWRHFTGTEHSSFSCKFLFFVLRIILLSHYYIPPVACSVRKLFSSCYVVSTSWPIFAAVTVAFTANILGPPGPLMGVTVPWVDLKLLSSVNIWWKGNDFSDG